MNKSGRETAPVFMGTILTLKKWADSVDLKQTAELVLLDNERRVTKLLRDQHLRGESGNGGKISPKYSYPYYALRKERLNPRPGYGTPDLEYSGEMHDTLYIEEDRFTFHSPVEYFQDLLLKYGDAFVLSPDSLRVMRQWFVPEVKKRIAT